MTEQRKKLPLPAGQVHRKKPSKAVLLGLAGLLLACAGAAYLILAPGGVKGSAKAFLNIATIEIRVLAPGKIEYAARAGQPVAAGEAVLRMDSSAFEKAARDAEAVVSEQAGAVPQRSRNLMLRYLAIPQSEGELAEAVQKAQKAEKEQKAELDALAERQAVFSLELRRLELKRTRLPEEEARMEAMRVEEDLMRASLEAARAKHQGVSLERAAAERQLRTKLDLARALRSLPGQQRERLYALETEFHKMYEAERNMALASINSPKSGLVLSAALNTGDTAREGDVALHILPEGQENIWVTAYFEPDTARKMQLGRTCTVNIEAASPLALQGVVAERLPYVEEQGKDIPFKIRLTNPDAERFVGLLPGTAVRVSLDKGNAGG